MSPSLYLALGARYIAFARLLASVGLNAISLSNVNGCNEANIGLLSTEYVAPHQLQCPSCPQWSSSSLL